jgi:hypothetical protein
LRTPLATCPAPHFMLNSLVPGPFILFSPTSLSSHCWWAFVNCVGLDGWMLCSSTMLVFCGIRALTLPPQWLLLRTVGGSTVGLICSGNLCRVGKLREWWWWEATYYGGPFRPSFRRRETLLGRDSVPSEWVGGLIKN